MVLLSVFLTRTYAFSASPQPSFLQGLASFFDQGNKNVAGELQIKRETLKKSLLDVCKIADVDRSNVESIIEELRAVQPFEGTATSPLLQREWLLTWTTEKEINVFSDWNISGDITQTITSDSLENLIPFKKGGSFGVKGKIAPNDDIAQRTNFEFESATIDLQWFKFTIPPVGKGWFDTLYLDEDLRVDVNSRNDILICIPR